MPFSFFSVRNEKPEPRHRAIPVFLMLIGAVVFTRMSQPLFLRFFSCAHVPINNEHKERKA